VSGKLVECSVSFDTWEGSGRELLGQEWCVSSEFDVMRCKRFEHLSFV
jgi:hypothetical protein